MKRKKMSVWKMRFDIFYLRNVQERYNFVII